MEKICFHFWFQYYLYVCLCILFLILVGLKEVNQKNYKRNLKEQIVN